MVYSGAPRHKVAHSGRQWRLVLSSGAQCYIAVAVWHSGTQWCTVAHSFQEVRKQDPEALVRKARRAHSGVQWCTLMHNVVVVLKCE